MSIRSTAILFSIIFIEGYVVLASELLAIRLLIPFVGSGTEVVAIIISGVLFPLSVGYYVGGRRFQKEYHRAGTRRKERMSVRKILVRNLLTAMIILSGGLSYVFLEVFFSVLTVSGVTHHVVQTTIYASLFLVFPTFLLAQTVPLVSNYFSRHGVSEITGKMVFFSTAGSFLGSIVSTLVLMTTIGVHHTVVLTLGMLVVLVLILTRRWWDYSNVIALLLLVLLYSMNSKSLMEKLGIVSNNQYNMVTVEENVEEGSKTLFINRSPSAKYTPSHTRRFEYLQFLERNFLNHLPKKGTPKHILVIGAGGFTFGQEDIFNRYVYVDIDTDLKNVAEEHFLPSPLSPNKEFSHASARAFLMRDTRMYDMIFIDVFTNRHTIPMEATTKEFLEAVRARLNPQGIVISNVISSPGYRDRFSVRYKNSFSAVFPAHSRQIISDFNPWKQEKEYHNTLFLYFDGPFVRDGTVYTDDKNGYFLDK